MYEFLRIADITSIAAYITVFTTLLTLIWSIFVYILKRNQEYFNKFRSKLSELEHYLQQVNNSVRSNAISILSQELSSKLFDTFDLEILQALFSTAQPDSRTHRLEPVILSVIQNNKDIQNLLNASNNIHLILEDITQAFPYYGSLLSGLSKLLIHYKQNRISAHRILVILINKRVADQFKYQLEEHKDSKLTKELFSNIIYHYIISKEFYNSDSVAIQEEAGDLAHALITSLIAKYSSFSDSWLLWGRYKQVWSKKYFERNPILEYNLSELFSKIQTDFNKDDRAKMFTQIGRILQTLHIN